MRGIPMRSLIVLATSGLAALAGLSACADDERRHAVGRRADRGHRDGHRVPGRADRTSPAGTSILHDHQPAAPR